MAKNFVQCGDTLELAAPYDRNSGEGALIGALFGVAMVDVLNGVSANFALEGVFTLAKATGAAWTVGAAIYWDDSAKNCTTTSAGNTRIGVATAAAGSGDTTGNVRLIGAGVNDVGTPLTATATKAAGGSNVAEVTITVKDAAGNAVAAVHNLDVWLSDDADGEGLTGTTASGTVQAKSASGTVLSAMVAKKALRVQTLKTGVFVLEITDTAKTAFKVAVSINGKTAVVATLATGNYG
ncbi:DUF2190 family protein [Methylocystis parvus]|uniref:DUF2190 family protein n=1 Tax=Methylocystis parvus TaxID=134 RepID=UPI003C730164